MRLSGAKAVRLLMSRSKFSGAAEAKLLPLVAERLSVC